MRSSPATAGRATTHDRGRHLGLRLLALTVSAWVALAIVHYFSIHILSNLLIFAFPVVAIAWLLAVVVNVGALWLAPTNRLAFGLLLAGAVSTAAIALADWRQAFAVSWFEIHRSDFAAVAALMRSHEVGTRTTHRGSLPDGLRHISVSGDALLYEPCGSHPVLLVPAFEGILGGSYGFVYLACRQDGGRFDADADTRPDWLLRFDLGDGWWWADEA